VANAERLRTFTGPVLLAWAPSDRFFRIEDGRRLADCFDNARLIEIPDSATFVAHDQPERLASEVASFVASTNVSRPG
jgi:pimeloyl-ACP methyl ester carboxylesterase